MKQTIILTALGLLLFLTPFLQAQTQRGSRQLEKSQAGQPSNPASKERGLIATSNATVLRGRIKQCMTDTTCLRILAEYGGMFVGNTSQITLPLHVYFHDEGEVQQFQKRVGRSTEIVNGIRVELQTEALKAYVQARNEAKQHRLDISPRGTNAARRSYAHTVKLWRGRVEAGLSYWVRRGQLAKADADKVRSLQLGRQVSAVLMLEDNQLFFGNGFGKSILQSVAAPGASQHNAMLALDIEQFNHPLVREIMMKHGWFQTVQNDAPHFTYLGVKEAALGSLGLRRVKTGDRTIWLPRIELQRATEPAGGRRNALPLESENAETGSAKSPQTRNAGDQPATGQASVPSSVGTGRRLVVTFSSSVKIPQEMMPPLRKLSQLYFERTGKFLHITSGYRTANDQAKAMHRNLIAYGKSHVLATYGGSNTVREIVSAYQRNEKNGGSAIKAMEKVIQEQIRKGIYISNHLLHNALDIRLSSANRLVLRSVVHHIGGRLLIEPDHYHVEFRSRSKQPTQLTLNLQF